MYLKKIGSRISNIFFIIKFYLKVKSSNFKQILNKLNRSILINFLIFFSLGIILNKIIILLLISIIISFIFYKRLSLLLSFIFILTGFIYFNLWRYNTNVEFLSNLNQIETLQGVVLTNPIRSSTSLQFIIEVASLDTTILVKVNKIDQINIGDNIKINCKINKLKQGYIDYYLSQNIFYSCSSSIYILNENKSFNFSKLLFSLKSEIDNKIKKDFTGFNYQLFNSFIFGDRHINTQLKQILISSGFYHLTTISITYFSSIISTISLISLINRRYIKFIIILLLTIISSIVIAGDFGTTKSILITLFISYESLLGRRADLFKITLLLIFGELLLNPFIYLSQSFIYFIISLISISLFYKSISLILRLKNKMILIMISSSILTSVYSIIEFGKFSIIGLVINILILPIHSLFILISYLYIILRLLLVNNIPILFLAINTYIQNITLLAQLLSSNQFLVIKPNLASFVLILILLSFFIINDFRKTILEIYI